MSQDVGVSGKKSSDSVIQVHSLSHDTLGRGWEGGEEREEDRKGGGERERTGRGEKRGRGWEGGEERSRK